MTPIMCSYKIVQVSFEVWGLQTRAEDLIQRVLLFWLTSVNIIVRMCELRGSLSAVAFFSGHNKTFLV
jgi:hypothetical protein